MRRLLNLNWIRSFEASARHLSFTGAARELNMTQAGISQHIRLLEGQLRPLSPLEQGQGREAVRPPVGSLHSRRALR